MRAYEQAGFRWQRIWSDRLLGPSWLMLKERPPSAGEIAELAGGDQQARDRQRALARDLLQHAP